MVRTRVCVCTLVGSGPPYARTRRVLVCLAIVTLHGHSRHTVKLLVVSISENALSLISVHTLTHFSRAVLCGRGGGINKHIGNVIYRRIVDYNKAVYQQVPKRQRMLVSQSIVQTILNAGGRFLQEQTATDATTTTAKSGTSPSRKRCTDSNITTATTTMTTSEWTEIQFRKAVQKTSQALREKSDADDAVSSSPTSTKAASNSIKYTTV
jgi:hypothetical protein